MDSVLWSLLKLCSYRRHSVGGKKRTMIRILLSKNVQRIDTFRSVNERRKNYDKIKTDRNLFDTDGYNVGV